MRYVDLHNPYYATLDEQKARQLDGHDAEARAIVDVPPAPRPGPPAPYDVDDFLYHERMRHILDALPEDLRGLSVLVVCAGLGNYGVAEMLAAGAEVTLSDLSPVTVERARQRWAGHERVHFAVADAEKLPFADGSFDVCYVHAGLHHLPRPTLGIFEMYRVARRQLVFVEAQDSWLLRALSRGKIAADFEPSGNYVYRFTRRELHKLAASLGARAYGVSTFANQTSSLLSEKVYPRLRNRLGFGAFRLAYRALNAVLGPAGNVMVVSILKA